MASVGAMQSAAMIGNALMPKAVHVDRIMLVTVSYFGLTVYQLKRGRKSTSRVTARTLICGLCQEHTHTSVLDLAELLQIDYSTVCAARKRHKKNLGSDQLYKSYYESIKQELGL